MAPQIHQGDCLEVMRSMPDNSVDACVTDPPYGLGQIKNIAGLLTEWMADRDGDDHVGGSGFMGRAWDKSVPGPRMWRELLRILKPGAYALVFAGSRTCDLMGIALRLAGFEVTDQIFWTFGCMSDDTEILINGRWEPCHKAMLGGQSLCYNKENNSFEWHEIQDFTSFVFEGDAYRIQSDRTDQLLTGEHRCLVERDGEFEVHTAKSLCETTEYHRVPFLEDLPIMPDTFCCDESRSKEKKGLLGGMQNVNDENSSPSISQNRVRTTCDAAVLPCLRERICSPKRLDKENEGNSEVFQELQREIKSGSHEGDRTSWAKGTQPRIYSETPRKDDGGKQSSLEGRCDLLQDPRELQGCEIRPMPSGVLADGTQGRLCDGTSADCCKSDWSMLDTDGSGSSCESHSVGQPNCKSGAVHKQFGSQKVRTHGKPSTTLARVTVEKYSGVMWCVTVPTGFFVARRNGKIFVTGNSGFPKGADIGKMLDKAAGMEREVLGSGKGRTGGKSQPNGGSTFSDDSYQWPGDYNITAPATEAACEWDGYRSQLKPAHEPILVCRKPLDGTIAQNALKWGTGAFNIDGCRVGYGSESIDFDLVQNGNIYGGKGIYGKCETKETPPRDKPAGRYPANLILQHAHDCDGSVCGESCPIRIMGEQSGVSVSTKINCIQKERPPQPSKGSEARRFRVNEGHSDTGTAARYFTQVHPDPFYYSGKATKKDRTCDGTATNTHPTVKPRALIKHLVTLIMPPSPDAVVIDPFGGSGTTAIAAKELGRNVILIEREPEYIEIIHARLNATAEPDQPQQPAQLSLLQPHQETP